MDPVTLIARAKLVPPRLPQELISRPRLLDILNAALTAPIVLVSAPAGYGKSTLLEEWLARVPLPACWVSLEEDDNDLNRFASSLLAAIRTLFPGALNAFHALLNGPQSSDPRRLGTLLCDEISELPGEFILTLDDYHLIKNPAVQQFMDQLFHNMPTLLHLVVATRIDLPMPLARLRGQGQLYQVRSRDLRFTPDEACAFLRCAVGGDLSEEIMQQLAARTEGWVTALRFAALAIRAGTKPQDVIKEISISGNRYLMEYFLDEIWAQQSPALQEFLLKSSVLDRFTIELADAVLEWQHGEDTRGLVQQLLRNELVTAISGEQEWYRYHRLLRDFLRGRARAECGKATILQLHRRASFWYAQQGFVTEAIQHALRARDYDGAAQLVETKLYDAIDREVARPLLESWLPLFPTQVLEERIELVMARIWLLSFQFKVRAAAALMSEAGRRLADMPDLSPARRRRYAGDLAYFQSALAYFTCQPEQAIEYAERVFENVPLDFGNARGNAVFYRAHAYEMLGKEEIANRLFSDALKQDFGVSPSFSSRVMVGLCARYLSRADLGNVITTAKDLLRLNKDNLPLSTPWAHYFLGLAHYELNDLERAAQVFSIAAELRYTGHVRACYEGLAWLALTQQAQGLTERARATFELLETFADEIGGGVYLLLTGAYRARLALMQGDSERALRWATGVTFDPKPYPLFEIEPHLTQIHALLTSHNSTHLRAALDETNALLEHVQTIHNPWRQIALYALKALALDAARQTAAALDTLQQSLTLAAPHKFIRTYVDLGPAMARLLDLLLTRRFMPPYVQQILAAFPSHARPRIHAKPSMSKMELDGEIRNIEPLTIRELQVLEGLTRRMSRNEIAAQLMVSPSTIKTHTHRLYSKLGVNSRDEAVRVALAFGILEKSATFPAAPGV